MRIRSRSLYQSRALAHSLSPPCSPLLLQEVRCQTRAVHTGELQRPGTFDQGIWRQAANIPSCPGRFSRPYGRTARQADQCRGARLAIRAGGQGKTARCADALGWADEGQDLWPIAAVEFVPRV